MIYISKFERRFKATDNTERPSGTRYKPGYRMMIMKFDGVTLMFWSFIESIDGINIFDNDENFNSRKGITLF